MHQAAAGKREVIDHAALNCADGRIGFATAADCGPFCHDISQPIAEKGHSKGVEIGRDDFPALPFLYRFPIFQDLDNYSIVAGMKLARFFALPSEQHELHTGIEVENWRIE